MERKETEIAEVIRTEKTRKIFVTRKIPEEGIELLREYFVVEVNPDDRELTREELLNGVKGKDGVLCMLSDVIDAEVIQTAGTQCKVFANYAVGYNNIDIKKATELGIAITNTPDVLSNATADLAWALLFAAARRVVESDEYTRAGKFKGWDPIRLLGMDITGKTLGVIGTGRIGGNFARKANAFDMKVLYNKKNRDLDFENDTGALFTDFNELLAESDFVSLHVPLTEKTRHLIGEKELNIMKKTAILINTSRGPVVDEKALVKALKERTIWAAGLDVYENEPEIEADLLGLDNVVLTPHIASGTYETRIKMALLSANSIVSVLNGETPKNCLNPEVINM